MILPKSLINLGPNLTINITAIIPITGMMIVSGGHNPSTDIAANASSSFMILSSSLIFPIAGHLQQSLLACG
jgi:hypothetical protein